MMAACYRVRSYDKMWNNTRIIGATFEEKKNNNNNNLLVYCSSLNVFHLFARFNLHL